MPVYNPLVPTGTVNLNVDYQNLQGNFEQANIVYGTDHYPFDNADAGEQGFHNTVTTPPVVNNPPDGLPPATAAGILKFYAYQQYPVFGPLHYSRGPSNAVPTPLTNIHSPSAAIVLGLGATTNILDFTGISFAMCTLHAMNSGAGVISPLSQVIRWKPNIFNSFTTGSSLVATSSGNILQLINNSPIVLDVRWTLEIIRIG